MRFLVIFLLSLALASFVSGVRAQDQNADFDFAQHDAGASAITSSTELVHPHDKNDVFTTLDDDWQGNIARVSASWPAQSSVPSADASPEQMSAAPDTSTGSATNSFERALCDSCPIWGVTTFIGYDSWRGITGGSWDNNGIHLGANFGTRLGSFSDATGIGFQLGGSIGVYNWSGVDYDGYGSSSIETQGFITYGFFHKPNEHSKWNAAIVQDWMLNDNFGTLLTNPTLSQIRAQLGYAWNASNEIGLWGTCRVLEDERIVPGVGYTNWRPIDTLNLYWHYKWERWGADTTIWIGLPEQDRLGGSGSLGDYIAGAAAIVPLNNRFALYTLVTYMHPSSSAGAAGADEETWNFTIGVSFYPGCNARSNTVAGQCWMPALPVANNGTFYVDTNRH